MDDWRVKSVRTEEVEVGSANKYNQEINSRALVFCAWVAVFMAASLFSQRANAEMLDDLLSPDSEIRQKALYRLDSSETAVKEKIIARLIERSYNGSGQQDDFALKDLNSMGAAAIGPAVKIIDDIALAEKNPWVAICVNAGKKAVPELRKYLGSDEIHAVSAAGLMLQADPGQKEASAYLSKKLKSSANDKLALFCLRALSFETEPSSEDLLNVTARLDKPGILRKAALACLDKFGAKASPSVPEVLKVLKISSKEGVIIPLKVLGNCGEASYEAVPYLCGLAATDDIVLRLNVLRVIGEIGVDPARSLPVLEASLGNEDEFVIAAAAEAIGRFDKKAFRSVPALLKVLMSCKMNYSQDKIILALRAIGTEDALAAVDKFRKEIRQKKK